MSQILFHDQERRKRKEGLSKQLKERTKTVSVHICLSTVKTRRPRSGAQSGSRIYQFVAGGGCPWNLMPSSNLLKSKIPICGGGGGSWNLMLSSDLLKSKISICRGGGLWNLMQSSDLLKSKIPICVCVCGGGGESKFAKKKKKIFVKNFLSFRAKIGMVLFWILNTEWFANHNNHKYKTDRLTSTHTFSFSFKNFETCCEFQSQ